MFFDFWFSYFLFYTKITNATCKILKRPRIFVTDFCQKLRPKFSVKKYLFWRPDVKLQSDAKIA